MFPKPDDTSPVNEPAEGQVLTATTEPGPEPVPSPPTTDDGFEDFDPAAPDDIQPAIEPEPAPEPEPESKSAEQQPVKPAEGVTEDDLRFVQEMDAFMNAGDPRLNAFQQPQALEQQPAGEQAPEVAFNFEMTDDQLEELAADPMKLRDAFQTFGKNILETIRQQTILERQREATERVKQEMTEGATRFYQENPHLNTPHVSKMCGHVVTRVLASMEASGQQPDWKKAFEYTAKYVTARMKTHPHEFIESGALPSLPGGGVPSGSLPQAPSAAPGAPLRPVFAGGGGAARRTVPQKRDIDPLQAELDDLSQSDTF